MEYLFRASGKVRGCDPALLGKNLANRTILAKFHYYELFGQNLLLRTFGPTFHFSALFGKNRTSFK